MLTLGHAGQPPAPHDMLASWNIDGLVIFGLLVAWWLFFRGVDWPEERQRVVLFGSGLVVIGIAVLSPVDAAGEALASAHMIQHLMLMLIGAPLLAVARSGEAMLRGMPRTLRKTLGKWRRIIGMTPNRTRGLAQALAVWLGYAVILWLWHMPGPYQAALDSEIVHALEHVSFLGAAVLFWRLPLVAYRRSGGVAVLGVFTTALHSTILAALFTFSSTVWYAAYLDTTQPWGLTPLDDQQLAGVIMWVPGGLLYTAAGLCLFALWVHDPSREPRTLHT